jgi:hypothetical protein
MSKGFHDPSRTTGRRGFFRQVLLSAVETVEQVGREMASRSLEGFREPPRYTPPLPPVNPRAMDPQYVVYGPPWPPPYGPYVTLELRARLLAQREAEREKQVAPISHDEAEI